MMMERTFSHNYKQSEIILKTKWLGEDLIMEISGGERPHLGGFAIAYRVSEDEKDTLHGAYTIKSISLPHHREEDMLKTMVKKASALTGTTVMGYGGIHYDHLNQEEIREILNIVEGLLAAFLRLWKGEA